MTIEQTFQIAAEHHQAGKLAQAGGLYREVLARHPTHAGALQNLGLIAHQVGRNDAALDLIRRAVAVQPNNAETHNNLALVLKAIGRVEESIAACRRAVAIDPNCAEAFCNLGNALRDTGEVDEAIVACQRALAIRPNYAQAYNNLGNALKAKGQLNQAIAAYRQALAIMPTYPEAHNNLGNALRESNTLTEAVAAYHQAIALRPGFSESYINLAAALRDLGQLDEAIALCRKAIGINPKFAEGHNNLGVSLKETGQLSEAIAAYRRALALKPNYAEACSNLGNALRDAGQLDEAVAAYQKALAAKPDDPQAYTNLGSVLKDRGQLDEAVAAHRKAIELKADFPEAHSNLIFCLQFHPGYDTAAIAEELARFNRQHAVPLKKFVQPHSNDRDPRRRLRIGYVSPDFRDHPVGRLMLPLLANHDKTQVEVFAYSQSPAADAITGRLRSSADHWRNVFDLSDDRAADLIRKDQIDILVDLTMHTARNRLLVFARKPAPVQACFLGYPGRTGVESIDYRLTDPYLDPPGVEETAQSERAWRVADCFWCHDPVEGADVATNSLPAAINGYVTFGCLNAFCKVSKPALELWAQVLTQVGNSRLLLLSHPGEHVRLTVGYLQSLGIDAGRVEFIPRLSRIDYLRQYHRIDLGLDSLPYNGHTTSLDSLWMGVPFVSLVGHTVVGRGGLSVLSNVGLPKLVAASADEFVRIAVELAGDLGQLSELRSKLRGQMRQSPLMDGQRYARNIESAYREIWEMWCAA